MIASGLPVIEFKDGTFDYFFDDQSAILCDLNVKHLKDELLDYINNPQKLETLNNNAMKHLKELSWEKSAQQFSNIINDLKQ